MIMTHHPPLISLHSQSEVQTNKNEDLDDDLSYY